MFLTTQPSPNTQRPSFARERRPAQVPGRIMEVAGQVPKTKQEAIHFQFLGEYLILHLGPLKPSEARQIEPPRSERVPRRASPPKSSGLGHLKKGGSLS